MTHAELIAFLKDLIPLIQEKYDSTLGPCHKEESAADYQFRNGQNFAYYETLDLIHSQLLAFGIPPHEFAPIVPELGRAALKDC